MSLFLSFGLIYLCSALCIGVLVAAVMMIMHKVTADEKITRTLDDVAHILSQDDSTNVISLNQKIMFAPIALGVALTSAAQQRLAA